MYGNSADLCVAKKLYSSGHEGVNTDKAQDTFVYYNKNI